MARAIKIFLATSVSAIALLPHSAHAIMATAGFAAFALTASAGSLAVVTAGSMLVTMGAQFALKQMLAPKAKRYAGSAINIMDSLAAAPVVYGTARMGGVVFYQETTGPMSVPQNERPETTLHRLIGVAGHEINGFIKFYIDGEEATVNAATGEVTSPAKYSGGETLRILTHNGADFQTVDANLEVESENFWTSQHRAYGFAYIYARAAFEPDIYTQGPPVITAVIEGKKVYDPRDGSTSFSSNAALCLRDYLLTSKIAADYELDDTSFAAAANICDEDVALDAGGTEKRYSCDGFFSTEQKPMDIINEMVKCMAGSLWYSQGKWVCKAGAYTESVMTLTEDDAFGPLSVITRASRRDLFNRVTGSFRGAETNWQPDTFPPVLSDQFLEDDGNEVSSTEIDLQFTSSSSRAQRIAKILMYRSREQIVVTGNFGLRAAQLTPGDTIKLTNSRFGFAEKTFEVVEWSFGVDADGAIVVPLTLQEISAGVYDWDADETLFEANNTFLARPDTVVTVGVAVSEEQRVSNEQIVNVLVATITVGAEANSNVDRVEVQYRDSTTSQYKAMGTGELVLSGTIATGRFEALNVDLGSYDVRARAINAIGVRGSWLGQTGLVQGDGSPPDDVTGFAASASDGTVHIGWIAVSDPKLSHYVIRHSVLQAGASFSNATTAAQKISRPGTSVSLPARAGTYMVKAYSKLGTASTEYSSFVLPAADLRAYANNSSQTEHSGFSGTKTGCSVDGGFLKITDPASAPSSATYDFSNYIDTGSVRRTHTYVHVRTVRSAPSGASAWDGISGNWDTWPGNWDSWTSGLQTADTDVQTYISTTDDDPSGSPVWSAYRLFQAGDFSGRAFRYRVILSSTADGISPAIDELVAHVGYD